jgi:hypothetical protein
MKRFPSLTVHRSRLLLAILFVSVEAWPVSRALGCACCSDHGTRDESTQALDDYYRTQIRGMEFAPEAQLFLTDAGDDQVKGITAISDTYRLVATLDDKQWRLTFHTKDGKTGTLALPIPAKLGTFQVDPRDGKKSVGGGPLLYKEWRWTGVPVAGGIFQKGAQRYALVFQGHGNRCDNGSDFTHWHLEITGKNISYTLFGAFKVDDSGAETTRDSDGTKKTAE